MLPSRGTPEPGARSQWQCSHAKERVVCSHGTPALPLFQYIAAATLNPTPQSKAHWPCFCCLPWCNRPFVAAQVIILNSKVVLTPAFTSCVLLVFCQAAPDESRSIITSAQAILDRENYFVRVRSDLSFLISCVLSCMSNIFSSSVNCDKMSIVCILGKLNIEAQASDLFRMGLKW